MLSCFHNMKISHKITLGFLALILLPLVILLTYNFSSFTKQSNEQLIQNGNYILGNMEQDVNEKLDSVETITQSLTTNGSLISFLSRSFAGPSSFEEYTQTILPLLLGAENTISPFIEHLWIVTGNNTIPQDFHLIFHKSDVALPELWDFIEAEKDRKWYFSPENLSQNSLDNYLSQKFYYIQNITSPYGKSVGYAIVQIKSSTLFSGYLQSREPNTAFFLLDEENRPYMANIVLQKDFIFPAVSQEKPFLDRSTLYLTGSSPSRLPLRFGLALASSEQDVLLQNSFLTIFLVGLLSMVFLFIFYAFIRSITSRLQSYASDMETIAASGFQSSLQVDQPDEIGEIGMQFNATLQKVRSLMQENIQKETAYKDVQLQALLLQINPHFIYNTLDLFVGKLTLNGEYEIADYLCDFAQMIRYNTVTTRMFISLRDEVDYVENYVNLQRCRYGDSVIFRTHISSILLEIQVLRFLLQPIVENSFVHGFEGKPAEAQRMVVIGARRQKGTLILRIRDNGHGIGREQVNAMNQRFEEPYRADSLKYETKKKGIGLENINDRIHLFYNNTGGLRVNSRKERYTSVFLFLKL